MPPGGPAVPFRDAGRSGQAIALGEGKLYRGTRRRMVSSDSTAPLAELGERLSRLEPRLRLLVRHLASRAVRARVDATDLVQETFLRALESRDSLPRPDEGDEALWRYLARIARNSVIDAARSIRALKRDRETRALTRSDWSRVGPSASQLLAQTAGPQTRAIGAEVRDRLADRFDRLSAEHRRVIGLRQLEGLSARETAKRMGRSETAVHSLYRRALEAWHEGLEETE